MSQDEKPTGVRCPKCNCGHLFVVYTRRQPNGKILRRRQCRYCGRRVTTLEKAQ